jgi:hypothetical protein
MVSSAAAYSSPVLPSSATCGCREQAFSNQQEILSQREQLASRDAENMQGQDE